MGCRVRRCKVIEYLCIQNNFWDEFTKRVSQAATDGYVIGSNLVVEGGQFFIIMERRAR